MCEVGNGREGQTTTIDTDVLILQMAFYVMYSNHHVLFGTKYFCFERLPLLMASPQQSMIL